MEQALVVINSLKKLLNDYNTKITKARDLLLTGDLDGADYKIIKNDCERQVSIIEGKLVVLSTKNEADLSKANDLLDQAGDLIEGVLTQVTGTDYNEPGEKPTTGAAADSGAGETAPGKSDNDELIRLKLTELNKLLRT